MRRIADPHDDLGHAEIVDDLLLEYVRMQDVVFKTYGTKLDMLMDCVRRARPEKNKAAVRRSVFSLCLQSEEDRILQAMEAYYATQNYEVHVLICDGCLVSRKDDKPFPAPLTGRLSGIRCPSAVDWQIEWDPMPQRPSAVDWQIEWDPMPQRR